MMVAASKTFPHNAPRAENEGNVLMMHCWQIGQRQTTAILSVMTVYTMLVHDCGVHFVSLM
jgi:hypothetical protein